MFETEKTNGKEASYARKRINLYLESNPDSSLNEIGYVPVQLYVITSKQNELITDGLNACTALAFEAQGKVFLAHFTMNVESRIPAVLQSIRREFDIAAFQHSDIKLKVLLGAWEGQTDSLDSVLILLHQLTLLNRFVKQVQQHVRSHINEIVENTSVKRQEIYQFLVIDNIKNKNGIKNLAAFINKIKSEFTDLPEVVLEQQTDTDQCASTRKLATLHLKQLSHGLSESEARDFNNLDDAITEINIIIEQYYQHLLPGQQTKLFGGEPKHTSEVRTLQSVIEQIRQASGEDMRAQLEAVLLPFIDENQKGGPRFRDALIPIYNEIHDKQSQQIIAI